MTAVMNSYIGPLMVEYVDRIQEGAEQQGFAGTVQFAQCAGGAITSEEARQAPIRTVQSGPVAGTIATPVDGRRSRPGRRHGGRHGRHDVRRQRHPRRPCRCSATCRSSSATPWRCRCSTSSRSGAGGGSIAWVDDQGRLNVGPQSAGARPGPACYGHGGTEATVTDADVVLGLIDPEKYLGGRMRLDRSLGARRPSAGSPSASAWAWSRRRPASPPSSTPRWPTSCGA